MPLEAITKEAPTNEPSVDKTAESTEQPKDSEGLLSIGSILSQKFSELEKNKKEKSIEKTDKVDTEKAEKKPDKVEKITDDKAEKKFSIPESITKDLTKKEDEEVDDIPDISKDQPEDVKKAFKTLRAKLKESQNKIKEFQKIVPSEKLEQEINKIKSEKEEIARQLEEAESYLQVHKLEGSKEYKNLIGNPLNEIKDGVKALATKYEVSASTILDIFTESDRAKRNELLAGVVESFNEVDKMDLLDMSRQYVGLIAKDKYLRDNAKEAIELLESKTNEKTKAELESKTQAELKALDSAWKQLSENVPLFKKTEDNEEWNQAVDTIEKTAREVKLGELQPTDIALMKYQALAFPLSLKVIHTLSSEIESLKKSLSEYQKGEPSTDKMGESKTSEITEDDKGLTFGQSIAKKAFN